MVKGIYTAASGMITQYKKMDVVSNNIANAGTTGYKKDAVITEAFGEVLVKKINDPSEPTPRNIGTMSMGAKVDNVFTNFSQGSLIKTESPFDLAIEKEGFMAVSVVNDLGQTVERYTRDGGLTVTNTGQLVTNSGNAVLGNNGPIQLPSSGDLVINDTGDIFVDGQYLDRIKLVDFEDKTSLRKIGDNLFATTAESAEKDFSGRVLQGYLEGSNVNVVKEMVEMINVSRAYESSQKVLQANDETLGKAVNEVGKL